MRRRTFRCIRVHEAEALLERDDVLVLDIRDAEAFKRSHIEGARHVSIDNLFVIAGNADRARPVLVYCHHGYASREYAQVFVDRKFTDVYSLDGGYQAWTAWLDAARESCPQHRPVGWRLRTGERESSFA